MHRSAPTPPLRGLRRTLPLAAALLAVAGLLAPGAAASAATPADQWGAIGADGADSGTNTGEHVLTAATASKVRRAWTVDATEPGGYPPVVLGGVAYSTGTAVSGGTGYPRFTASSARTGALLWSVKLPVPAEYGFPLAGSGHTVLVAVDGTPGSLLAIDTTAHRILWHAGASDAYPGVPVTDGTRAYQSGSGNGVNAYSLTTGAKLWSVPVTTGANGAVNPFSTVAVSGGVVYATTELGLVAFDAATGKRLWHGTSTDASRQPVVAGGRVLVTTQAGVAAYPAAGCGRSTCPATWTRAIAANRAGAQTLASADASTVLVTSEIDPTGTVECDIRTVGTVTRLSASTGAVQWSTKVGDFTTGLVRGGDTAWVLDEYRSTANGCAEEDRILAYSVTATGSTPAAAIPLPSTLWGFPQSLAVASGTLFESTNQDVLVGYRIPNS